MLPGFLPKRKSRWWLDKTLQAIVKDGEEEMSTEFLCESLQLQPLASSEVERVLGPSSAGYWQVKPLLGDQVQSFELLSDQFQLGLNKLQDAVDISNRREERTLVLPSNIRESLQLRSQLCWNISSLIILRSKIQSLKLRLRSGSVAL